MTELKHGPVTPEMLLLLTAGKSVLLPREGNWWPYQDRSPVTFDTVDGGLVVLRERPDESFFADRFEYGGEWTDDTRKVISAPVGGWTENTVPGRTVRRWYYDGSVSEGPSESAIWSEVGKFSLIEDAKAETLGESAAFWANVETVPAKAEGDGAGDAVKQRAYDLLVAGVEGFLTLSAGKKSDIHTVLVAALTASPQVPAVAGPPREPTQTMMEALLYHSSHDTTWSDAYTMWTSAHDTWFRDGDPLPTPTADQSGVIGALQTIALSSTEQTDFPKTYKGGFEAGCAWAAGVASRALAAHAASIGEGK